MVHVNKNLFEYLILYQNPGSQVVATHILAFMVVGINNSIKESVGHFATTSAKAEFLFQKMWKAVYTATGIRRLQQQVVWLVD